MPQNDLFWPVVEWCVGARRCWYRWEHFRPMKTSRSEDFSRHAELLLQLELHLDVVLHLRETKKWWDSARGGWTRGARYEQAAEDVVPNPAQLAVAKALKSVKGQLGTANLASGIWGSSVACTKLYHTSRMFHCLIQITQNWWIFGNQNASKNKSN